MKKLSLLVWTVITMGVALSTAWIAGVFTPAAAQGNATTLRVSVASNGSQGNAISSGPSLASNGHYVAFEALSDNLVARDTNRTFDVFVHNLQRRQTELVSVASDGTQANQGLSGGVSLSADGRYVAFLSDATNLVLSDTNEVTDVFVHDRETDETSRVSISSDGIQGNATSWLPAISGDGRFVAFESAATNFVEGVKGSFVHDRQTGDTELVSVSSEGIPSNSGSIRPDISGDGRYVTFLSQADNLVLSDTNGALDVFVHDRDTGETMRASVTSDGMEGNRDAGDPAISADGRYIVFPSFADNLVPGDTNYDCPIPGESNSNCLDVFVHDLQTGETTRASIASDGAEGNSDSGPYYAPSAISADGRYVAFWSAADNLVPNDTNNELDAFRHDRLTGETIRVSVAADGSESHPSALSPVVSISGDGQRIAFNSDAPDLVPNDTNNEEDVFVRILSDGPTAVGMGTPSAISQRSPIVPLLLVAGIGLLLLAVREIRSKRQPSLND